MNIALRKPMSLADFLAWEERQELRYEFDGFQPVAITGGTLAHDRITFNLQRALEARLSGKPCRTFGPNVKILAAGKVRYPDAIVTCSPADFAATIADNPVVVFEVVSEDNARTDRIEKVRDYRATSSIPRYVILEQKSIGATVFTRHGAEWTATAPVEGETLQLPEIGIELPLDECYAGLDLPRNTDRDEAAVT